MWRTAVNHVVPLDDVATFYASFFRLDFNGLIELNVMISSGLVSGWVPAIIIHKLSIINAIFN